MVDVNIKPAVHSDIRELAANIRDADRREIYLVSMLAPESALKAELFHSEFAWTARADGRLVCMFGVSEASVLTGAGMPWLLATDLILEFQFHFLRRSKQFVDRMAASFPVLYNYVDVENTLAIRWLRWVGFEISETPKPWGLMQEPFYRFERRT